MSDVGGTLTPDQIRTALDRVATILSDQGVDARIDVYGGASMALAYAPNRTATLDVDGSYAPAAEIEAAAQQAGSELNLPSGWLNNRMSFALPPAEIARQVIIEKPGVTIRVGSARTMLALKLRASRPGRDLEDIAVLLRECDVSSAAEAIAIHDEFYLGEEEVSETGLTLLDTAFGEVQISQSDPPYTLRAIRRTDK